MEHLPPPDERDALLAGLVELAAQVRTEPLLRAPLIAPDPAARRC